MTYIYIHTTKHIKNVSYIPRGIWRGIYKYVCVCVAWQHLKRGELGVVLLVRITSASDGNLQRAILAPFLRRSYRKYVTTLSVPLTLCLFLRSTIIQRHINTTRLVYK